MNPLAMMRFKSLIEKFKDNHPKMPMFFAAASDYIEEGSVIELNIQSSDGKSICTNIRVTKDDIELIEALKEMLPKK